MNRHFEQVKEFHTACGVEMPEKLTLLGKGDGFQSLQCFELGLEIEVISTRIKKDKNAPELAKRISYLLEEIAELCKASTIEDQTDALTDLIYFAIGTFTLMGVKPEAIFDIVHAANMAKIDSTTGKVTRDSQGKIQKPPQWKELYAPEQHIKEEIERQRNEE